MRLSWDSLASLKFGGLALFTVGVWWWLYAAMTDRSGAPHRAWSRYVTSMETKLASMFIWNNASYIAAVQAAVVVTLVAGAVLLGLKPMLYAALVAVVAPSVVVSGMVSSRRAKIDGQVDAFALSLANALKTTASIGDALQSVVAVTPKPLKDELELALKQMRIGSSIPDALLAMSARVQAKALDVLISALLIGRQSGGDLPSILERTASSLRELKRLQEMTEKALRNIRISFGLSVVTTGVCIVYLPVMLPMIFGVYTTTVKGQIIAGQLVLAFCGLMYLGYKFTRIDF